ncbi:hypothetical protein C9374_013211 [Naegleria lovaniensis]|uniref:Protein kinase domain-containing protein n=1 Tax=Naegleria lovaniensis TaxID=51637 RepID=A0AA88GBJ0_NAELO|nr:uncharacterized protein C9374_013211 [Naegleria lovaniensis]KAG2372759.1 hypothetical protein C9374_013211 [Naegleria lovaniensis]
MDELLNPLFESLVHPLFTSCKQEDPNLKYDMPVIIVAGKNHVGKSTLCAHLMNEFNIRPTAYNLSDDVEIEDEEDSNDSSCDDQDEDESFSSKFFQISVPGEVQKYFILYKSHHESPLHAVGNSHPSSSSSGARGRDQELFYMEAFQNNDDQYYPVGAVYSFREVHKIKSYLERLDSESVSLVTITCPKSFSSLLRKGMMLVDCCGNECDSCTRDKFDRFINHGPLPSSARKIILYVVSRDTIGSKDKVFLESIREHEPFLIVNQADGLKDLQEVRNEVEAKLETYFHESCPHYLQQLKSRIYFHSCIDDSITHRVYMDIFRQAAIFALKSLEQFAESRKKSLLRDIDVMNGSATTEKTEHDYLQFTQKFDQMVQDQIVYCKSHMESVEVKDMIKNKVKTNFEKLLELDGETFTATISTSKLLDRESKKIKKSTIGAEYLQEIYRYIDKQTWYEILNEVQHITLPFINNTYTLVGQYFKFDTNLTLKQDKEHSFTWSAVNYIMKLTATVRYLAAKFIQRTLSSDNIKHISQDHIENMDWSQVPSVIESLIKNFQAAVTAKANEEKQLVQEKCKTKILHASSLSEKHVDGQMNSLAFMMHVGNVVNLISYYNFKEQRIDGSYLKIIRHVGGGSFGNVYHATIGKESVAVKHIEKEKLNDNVFHEIYNLMTLNHNNIVKMKGILLFSQPGLILDGEETKVNWNRLCHKQEDIHSVLIIMEYGGENLDVYLKKNLLLDKKTKLEILIQIGEAILHCHNHEILHRDVKLNNLLIDNNSVVRLCDFGFSKALSFASGSFLGTSPFPPEMNAGNTYGKSVDIFKFGEIIMRVWNGDTVSPTNTNHPVNALGMQCQDLLPEKRPTMEQALKRLKTIHETDYR